jgi:hypothetical protein
MKKLFFTLSVFMLIPLSGCGSNNAVSEPEEYSAPPVSEEDLKGSRRAVDQKVKDKVGQASEPVG